MKTEYNQPTLRSKYEDERREYMAIEFTKAIITGIIAASGNVHHGLTEDDFSAAGLAQADSLINKLKTT